MDVGGSPSASPAIGTKVGISKVEEDKMLRAEVGRVFEQVLHDSGVFKRDAKGAAAFDRFMEGL